MLPIIRLDRRSDVPLQRQLFEQFRDAITREVLQPGTRLPSTRDLAAELRVSRNCVVNAFRYLAAQGLIVSRSGAGTVVAAQPARVRIPPSTRPCRGRASRLSRLVTDASSGKPGPFRPGVPALDLFPVRTWRALLGRHWRNPEPALLAYGDASGYHPLREAIAAHLGATRGMRCHPDQLLIVHGAQQALDLTARVLLEPGDVACVEDPGYLGARSAFAATGARLVPVPLDRHGFDVAAARAAAPSPRLVHVTPSHQYPLGITMPLARRNELRAWCAGTGTWIVEDDYGSELRHDRRRELPAIHALTKNDACIYAGTFSHALAPVLRIGYVVSPPDLVDAFHAVAAISGGGPSMIEQAALAQFIGQGHLARHLRRLREAYAERQAALVAALENLDAVERIEGLDAGSHLVVHLRDVDEERVSRAAAARRIEVPLVRAYGNGSGLILGYGSTDVAAIREGVGALAAAILECGGIAAAFKAAAQLPHS